MQSFNRGEIPQALAQFFGLKGDFAASIDGAISPVVIVGALTESPYLRYSIPCARGLGAAAVALEFGVSLVRPAERVALQVQQIVMQNAKVTVDYLAVRTMTQANITTAGLSEGGKLFDLSGTEMGAVRPSSVWSGTHTTQPGSGIAKFTVEANSTVVWDIPSPGFILYGNDPGGIPGLAVWNDNLNSVLDVVTFVCREWPLPG